MDTFIFIVLLATSFTFFARTMWLFGRAVATVSTSCCIWSRCPNWTRQ